MKFALGGFGRIGIITELIVKVVPSKKYLVNAALVHHDLRTHLNDIEIAFKSDYYDAIVSESTVTNNSFIDNVVPSHSLFLLKEADSPNDLNSIEQEIKNKYHQACTLCLKEEDKPHHKYDLDFSMKLHTILKEDIVYYYPMPKNNMEDQMDLCHPWSDYIMDKEAYLSFHPEALKWIKKYDLAYSLVKEGIVNSLLDLPVLPLYISKPVPTNPDNIFPLCMYSEKFTDYGLGIGIMPTISSSRVKDCLEMVKALTDLCYDLGGIRYLYGIHNLTKVQIEKQYGHSTIQRWNEIKDQLDPKHLLNIGVVEHLD